MDNTDFAALCARLRNRIKEAPKGKWYVVESPWRATRYDRDRGSHRTYPTFVVRGSDDPHAGEPVLDSVDIDEWESEDYDRQLAESDANLYLAVESRNALPALLDRIEADAKRIAELEAALKDLYEETADYIKINHLGDVHHNTSMRNAARALGGE